jgi:hypothetical protein
MKKRTKPPVTPESIEHVFDVLDTAFRRTGVLLPKDEKEVLASESEIDLAEIELPDSLRDPQTTLEHGRRVLQKGFSIRPAPKTQSEASVALAQAARNGKETREDILDKMHEDRAAAERDSEKS